MSPRTKSTIYWLSFIFLLIGIFVYFYDLKDEKNSLQTISEIFYTILIIELILLGFHVLLKKLNI